jgi:hypothetical protein
MEHNQVKTKVFGKQGKTHKGSTINVRFVLEKKLILRWPKTQFHRFLFVGPSENKMAKQIHEKLS